MRGDTSSHHLTAPIVGLIGALGLAAVIAGAANWSLSWGPSVLVAGGLIGGCALIGWWARSWMPAVLSAMAATGVGMVLVGVSLRDVQPTASAVLLAAGILGILSSAGAAAIVEVILRRGPQEKTSEPPRSTPAQRVEAPSQVVADQLARVEHLLHDLHDLLSVSDGARRELFPVRDLEIIHHRLEQTLALGDHAAAERMIAIAQSLGHEGLVPILRGRIAEEIHRAQQQQAAAPLQAFEAAVQRRDWAGAYQHAAAVRAITPDAATAAHLEQRVLAARQEHKQVLERRFLDARDRDDVETAMATLKELDKYMSRDEAERLSREAQRVIQRHRERLTATFQAAVQEKRWSDAARVGNTIIEEYPNTRMAEEVRTMIEVIRTRATQTALARE